MAGNTIDVFAAALQIYGSLESAILLLQDNADATWETLPSPVQKRQGNTDQNVVKFLKQHQISEYHGEVQESREITFASAPNIQHIHQLIT